MALALAVLGLCLFADGTQLKGSHILGPALVEIIAIFHDPGAQWVVFVCAGIYFLAFAILRRRLSGGVSMGTRWNLSLPVEIWLLGLLAVAALLYALDYRQAVGSTQALTMLGAAALGQGAGLCEGRRQDAQGREGERESRKQKVESKNGASGTVLALIILLAAAVWQAEVGHFFQYRGQARWSGPWDNPNTFGVLMGAGAVLAVGLLVRNLRSKVKSQPSAECEGEAAEEHPTSNIQHPTSKWGLWVGRVFLLAAAGVMGVGLVKSYSRGAWLGAAVGVAYLLLNAEGRRKNAEWGKAESRKQKAEIGRGKAEMLKAGRHWLAVAVICASVLVLGFWSFGHAERAVARRAYSVANVNDFSWRNRMAAWEGGLQMMAEKPCFGFGWNQPEWVYNQYYRAAKVDEGMAFQLNGYFMLGATLGVPALLCFLTYVGLSFSPKPKAQSPKSAGGSSGRVLGSSELAKDDGAVATEYRLPITDYWLKTTCRGGAAVLLVGFWFDGGLFKLATAATFWMLLELGREEDHEIHSAAEPQPEELNKLHGLHELHRF